MPKISLVEAFMVFLAIGPAANGNVCFWHIADIDADDEQCPLIGTPRFGLVEHVNAFVNESETKTLASLDRGTNVTQVGLASMSFGGRTDGKLLISRLSD
jgi:hypothetical protein